MDGTVQPRVPPRALTTGCERSTAVNLGTCCTSPCLSIRIDQHRLVRPKVLPKLAVASTLAGCRAASGDLAPRTVVSQNGPHPARELVPWLVTALVTETSGQ